MAAVTVTVQVTPTVQTDQHWLICKEVTSASDSKRRDGRLMAMMVMFLAFSKIYARDRLLDLP